ncbi:MAG: sigma-70 family RNA polymerase sigma factor [Clostridiales bacterium]|nr:sigma-70 family RNA polymerase sigma factor [Clostridiales bacterium]
MNNEELERIYNEAYGPVYWTAYQLLKNEADSEDIVQETFVSLIESYDTIKDKTKVTAWLKKNAANKCLNRLTRSKTDAVEDEFFEDVEAMPEDFLPDTIVESEESRKVIMDIIGSSLSDDVRRTLVLYYFDEMTTKEIAEAQGIPQGTVLWRLNFAKKKIKKEVEKYEAKTDSKLYTMALPFLSKLFIAEAQQVPLKPIPPTLLDMTASAVKSVASEAAKTAASGAAKRGAGAAAGKIVAIGLGSAVAVGLIGGGIFLVCSHLLGNKPSAEDEVYASESETEEVEAVTEETAETTPEAPVVEINANEYLADYPVPGDGIMVYFKLAPDIDFYPDGYDTGSSQTFGEYYYNSINSEIGLAEVVCQAAEDSPAKVVFTCNPSYDIAWFKENGGQGILGDGVGTYTVSEPEICPNGLKLYTVQIDFEYDVTTQYIFEYQIDEDNLFEIYTMGFNEAFSDPICQTELEAILDYYRNVEDPILVVPDGTTVKIVEDAVEETETSAPDTLEGTIAMSIDNGWKEAYTGKIENFDLGEFKGKYGDLNFGDDVNPYFNLVFINDDAVPELVAMAWDLQGNLWINIYTFADGEVTKIGDSMSQYKISICYSPFNCFLNTAGSFDQAGAEAEVVYLRMSNDFSEIYTLDIVSSSYDQTIYSDVWEAEAAGAVTDGDWYTYKFDPETSSLTELSEAEKAELDEVRSDMRCLDSYQYSAEQMLDALS